MFKKRPKAGWGFSLLSFFFLIFPGNSYYATLPLQIYRPLVRQVDFQIPSPQPYPTQRFNNVPFPSISAQSVVVMDVSSSVLMYGKNQNLRLLPASTTKMMTALVASQNCPLDKIATVKTLDKTDTESLMGLVKDERITVENLLYGLLVTSGNDAAVALAENCSPSVAQFIYSMNQKAQQLSLKDTHFANVTGLEQENHYSSALDLARLATVAGRNSVFSKMVATKEIIVSDTTKEHWHTLKNKNLLLGKVWGVVGVKTGYTENAGECLVSLVERNGQKVVIVILKSQDRFGETEKIIDWVFNSFAWQNITPTTSRQ